MSSATDICTIPAELHTSARLGPRGRWGDFLELVKPRMNLLVLGTTMVGYCMAIRSRADWWRIPHVLVGTALCAAAAAILNQLVERRYDALMPRTANRPLPMGRVSLVEAMALGLGCGVVGTLYLLIFVNVLTAALGAATLSSYVLIYTPLKRLTTLNTIVGAIPGALPPVMGWTAATGSLGPAAVALFGILFVWQVPHFLAIATLYREDYRKGGFKMLPVVDPSLVATGRQIMLYTVALFPMSLAPAMIHASGNIYVAAALLLDSGFLVFAINSAVRRTRLDARKLFFASIIYLPVLLTVMMLDRI
jgi:protoheme IX farnesyltransferase